MFNIEEELKKLPGKPGVYIMHDASDAIIYVGKAISLKNRVRQYFQSSRGHSPKVQAMGLLLRTMSPQWMIVDEITDTADIAVMRQAGYCGVRLAATVHAAERRDLEERPLYRSLLQTGIFRTLLTIGPDRRVSMAPL